MPNNKISSKIKFTPSKDGSIILSKWSEGSHDCWGSYESGEWIEIGKYSNIEFNDFIEEIMEVRNKAC